MASRVVMIYEGRKVYDGDVQTLRDIGDGDLDQSFHALTKDESIRTGRITPSHSDANLPRVRLTPR